MTREERHEFEVAVEIEKFMENNYHVLDDCNSKKLDSAFKKIEEAFHLLWGDPLKRGMPSDRDSKTN